MNIFVEVKVTPDPEFMELLRAAVTVFAASTGIVGAPPLTNQNGAKPASEPEAQDGAPAKNTKTKAAKAPKEQPEAANTKEEKPAGETKSQKPSDATVFTKEIVRAKLAALSQSGKQAEVKALITKYGAEKLSDIPEDKYPDLIKDAEGL